MRSILIVLALSGCSVLYDVRDQVQKDVTGLQSEFARLYFKEKSQ